MQTLDELNQWLHDHQLHGLWTGTIPEQPLTPYLWKWGDIHQGLMAASELVNIDAGGRRGINVRHPNYPDRMSNTIHMSVQCVMPGEVATAHRHNPAAIRFIIQGSSKAFTAVEGEPMPMESGDFITTPNWTMHDHRNEGDEPVIWLDGLDVRFVGTWHFLWDEMGGKQPLVKPAGFSNRIMGAARPAWMQSDLPTPPMRYPWAETWAALTALRESESEGDPYDGLQVTFTHPTRGGATLPTIACDLHLLTPKRKTKAHRHLSTSIYHAYRGSGVTVVDGQRLEWEQGDIFLVPPWMAHWHENLGGEDALLFSMDDRPIVSALDLYREEEVAQ